jgi:hypothetical protein
MKTTRGLVLAAILASAASAPLAGAQTTPSANNPTWWDKYLYLTKNGSDPAPGARTSASVDDNVDISAECGPQSETYVTLNPSRPRVLAAGSNEIFRDPMRGYFSSDGGATWGGVDLPLPAPRQGTNDQRFGSDPSLAFDTRGNLYYSYIVVFFGNGAGVNGTEMAVARSTDGGRTYPSVTYFSFETGASRFNDKPMVTADTNAKSPFRDSVYVAWDAAVGGSGGGGVRVGRSSDHGASFSVNRADDPKGPGKAIGAVPFVGPGGEVYIAWNDYKANTIGFNRSFDGAATWGTPSVVAAKRIPFDIGVARVDRFNHWLSVDPVTGQVTVAFYDTRNDTTGNRYQTDYYLARSSDGVSWLPDTRVSDVSSNEHDCDGTFPCVAINYGNQQGDYEGLVSFGGVSYPIWTDSRRQLEPAAGCRRPFLMEEVFTAAVP